ncbi:MAG: pantoate--beta-alanine ligase [Phycisphaeraceae bacterium]|nr:pantoate--beta-alanine ligase [Phycisphaeraceae bacterium]MCB9848015.1 pantoate--beta-alanine ligase [Phycisphaeraceae bacterium]
MPSTNPNTRVRIVTGTDGLAAFQRGVFVATMGALHEGHAALIERAASIARDRAGRPPVVVSVFVNPTQFGEAIDYDRYPRIIETDAALCERAGAGCVFAPSVETVYPPDDMPPVPPLPRVATAPGLEDRYRVGHFAGVCQVIHRMFALLDPAVAIFGEKDWQQLKVIEAMNAEQGCGVEIVGAPTVREPDGLAMSSRNRFLVGEDRRRAVSISGALREAGRCATAGGAEALMKETIEGSGALLEYAVVRDAMTLEPIDPAARRESLTRPARVLAAARFGEVRLIDNMAWG